MENRTVTIHPPVEVPVGIWCSQQGSEKDNECSFNKFGFCSLYAISLTKTVFYLTQEKNILCLDACKADCEKAKEAEGTRTSLSK